MDYGGTMKGSRLVDVLDDTVLDKEFWNNVFDKINKLCLRIKSVKGNYDIDDAEIRWCSDRLEYWLNDERLLTKDEMDNANNLWRKYGKK